REGILLIGGTVGTGAGHWETHREDELIHILEGTRTLEIVCGDEPPRSFELPAGMMAVVPRDASHRFLSAGCGMIRRARLPGPHVDLVADAPRPHLDAPSLERQRASRSPSIVDLGQELGRLRMFRRTPEATAADRKGSVATLAPYRDGLLLAI